MKSLIFVLSSVVLMFCQPIKGGVEKGGSEGDFPKGDLPQVQIGFNAKASLNTAEQVKYADGVLSRLSEGAKQNFHIRIPGGTRSQKETSADWTDEMINHWVNLQRKHGFGFILCVNGNDTPVNQRLFIERWVKAGAKFSFIEMMNEYYLLKYEEGRTERKEVQRKVTAEIYTKEILPAFMPEILKLNIPIFLIAAPTARGAHGERFKQFNNMVTKEIRETYKQHNLGITLHLYDSGRPFDYSQINALRKQVPPGTRIAITESGNTDPKVTSVDVAAPKVYSHLRNIAKELQPGDFLIDHVLYNNYVNVTEAVTHPGYKGITPKGEAVLRLFNEIYPPAE